MNTSFTIKDVILTSTQITNNADCSAIALNVTDGYKYDNGVKTEEITHKKVTVVLQDNQYKQITVKVKDLKIPLTVDVLQKAGGQVKVKFKNLVGKFYRANSGEYLLSASADALEVITNG